MTFAPSPGRITALNLPGGLGVRIDTHIYTRCVVPPYYDSLLAKLMVHAENRPAALARLRRALDEFVVEGVQDQHGLLPAADPTPSSSLVGWTPTWSSGCRLGRPRW